MKFKWQLFILTIILIICHFIIFEAGNNKVKLKFSPEEINSLLLQQNPAAFWQKIAGDNSLQGLEIGYVLNILEDLQPKFNQKERVSLEAVKAFVCRLSKTKLRIECKNQLTAARDSFFSL